MRIALVHSFYSSRAPSGENQVVLAQADALRSVGHSVAVIARRTDVEETQSFHAIRAGLRVATGQDDGPMAELASFRPDIVHVHNLFPNFGTSWLTNWKGPAVVTLHNYRYVCANGLLFRDGRPCTECPDSGSMAAVRHACYRDSVLATAPVALRTRHGARGDPVIRRAGQVIVLSERALRLARAFGIPAEKLTLLPNFVGDEHAHFNAPDEASRFLAVGRLTPEKGFEDLLRAWPAGVPLDIIGDGPLRERIAARSTGTIRFLGAVSNDEWRRSLASYAALVFPGLSHEGAVPLTVVEAWEGSVPVIARAGSGAADEVDTTGAGFIYEDDVSLDAAVRACLDPERSLRRAAREAYEARFRPSTWIDGIHAVYAAAGAR